MKIILSFLLCLVSSAAFADISASTPPLLPATNLVSHSSTVGGTGWTNVAGRLNITTNNSAAPNGATEATLLVPNNTSFPLTEAPVAISSGVSYVGSLFVQAGTQQSMLIILTDGSVNLGALFNVNTLTITSDTTAGCTLTSSGIDPKANNNFRIWFTGSCTSLAGGTKNFVVAPWTNTGGTAVIGSTISVWGAQVQAASYPTNYVAN